MVFRVLKQNHQQPLHRKVLAMLFLLLMSCAPERSYRYVKWYEPGGLDWLEASDYVLGCYRQQTGEEVEAEVFSGVTVVSADITGMVFGYKTSTIFAKNVNGVRHGLARHIVNMRHPGEDHEEFIRSSGLCFGHCVNYTKFKFEDGCVY